ncbi:proteasome activator pa28 REG alpha/beta subunit [Mycena rebaudengoi]|nr:proteasome activator pa28 REG alpha/beta subunit [Mycena rebaudengoi]
MDKDLARRLEIFQKQATEAAEEIIFRTFPSKSTSASSSPYHPNQTSTTTDTTVYPAPASASPSQNNGIEPSQSKKRKLADDGKSDAPTVNDTQHARLPNLMLANKHMDGLHANLKLECEQLDQVKLWISLTMPRGDNFGVQIQEEVLAELTRAQDSAYNLRDSGRNDHTNRAKICSKLIKYPNIEDYALALKAHDDNQFYFARQHLIDLRNIYAVLTDLIHKNIEKIRAPRGNNSVGLY